MPTMSKLFAAALLAALGYLVADLVGGHLPPEERQGWLRPISAAFGILVGWRFLGKRVRGEWANAIGLGLSAGAVQLFCALVWFSAYEMLQRAMRMAYGGDPIAALEDMVAIAADFLVLIAKPDVIGAAVIGAIIAGAVVTAVSRRWP